MKIILLLIFINLVLSTPIIVNPINPNGRVYFENNTWYGQGDIVLNTSSLKYNVVIDGNLLITNQNYKYHLNNNKILVTGNFLLQGSVIIKEKFHSTILKNLVIDKYGKFYLKGNYNFLKIEYKAATISGNLSDPYNKIKINSNVFGIKVNTHSDYKNNKIHLTYYVTNTLLKKLIHNVPLVILLCFTIILVPLFIYFIYHIVKSKTKKDYIAL